jgi:hypothetical protein
MSSIVQSVLFKKTDYSFFEAVKWLKLHKFKVNKLDITNNWFRFRQYDPIYLKNEGYTHYSNRFIENDKIIIVIAYK